MSEADNEKVVRDYVERVWNRGEIAALEELTTPDFRYSLGGQPPRDRAAMIAFLDMTRTAFPDWRVEIEQAIAADEAVAVRWRGEVTHTGPFRGIPPTGKRIVVTGINIYAMRDGRVSAEWEQMDSLGMLLQIGALK